MAPLLARLGGARPLALAAALASALTGLHCARGELCLVACLEPVADAGADGGAGDAGSWPVVPWGTWAEQLTVPGCPPSPAPPLVVTTVLDELDDPNPQAPTLSDPSQAGPTLSLREAVWIASRRTAPSTILFAADVFPVDAPGRIQLLYTSEFPAWTDGSFCIDARGRGVVLTWAHRTIVGPCLHCQPVPLGAPHVLLGLDIENLPQPITLGLYPQPSQVAGCRFRGEPTSVALDFGSRGTVGPGNVFLFESAHVGLQLSGEGVLREVVHNAFGFDPSNGAVAPPWGRPTGIAVFAPTNFTQNIFAGVSFELGATSATADGASIYTNFSGMDRRTTRLPEAARTGVSFRRSAGPPFGRHAYLDGNFFVGLSGPAITVGAGAEVALSENRITGSAASIVFEGTPPVAPPTVVSASPTEIVATCPEWGILELFSDPGDQAETYLGQVFPCGTLDGGSPTPVTFTPRSPLAPGRFVTATLTNTDDRTSGLSTPVAVP